MTRKTKPASQAPRSKFTLRALFGTLFANLGVLLLIVSLCAWLIPGDSVHTTWDSILFMTGLGAELVGAAVLLCHPRAQSWPRYLLPLLLGVACATFIVTLLICVYLRMSSHSYPGKWLSLAVFFSFSATVLSVVVSVISIVSPVKPKDGLRSPATENSTNG